MVISCWYTLYKNKEKLPEEQYQHYHLNFLGIASIVLMKGILMENQDLVATFLWTLVGLGALYLGYEKSGDKKALHLVMTILTLTFLKSGWDSSALNAIDSSLISPSWFVLNSCLIILTTLGYYYISTRMSADPLIRDFSQAYSLLIFPFLVSAMIYKVSSSENNIQIYLSFFWSIVSFLYILIGMVINRKFIRLFGLILMFASAAKIWIVDIRELQFNMAWVFFADGILFILTPILYKIYESKLQEQAESGKSEEHL
jgi:hypothetical protein